MGKLIKAEDAKRLIYQNSGDIPEDTLFALLMALEKLPDETKHGHWIYTPTEPLGYIYSECEKGCCRFNYCPNCGTKMDGGE